MAQTGDVQFGNSNSGNLRSSAVQVLVDLNYPNLKAEFSDATS